MYLITWHGTIICQPDSRGTITHQTLPLTADTPPPMAFEAAALSDGNILRHPQLGFLRIERAAGGIGFHLAREGFYICAEPDTRPLIFNRTEASGWETFLPISAQDLADLQHILRYRWIVQATRRVIRRAAIRFPGGFVLQIGDFALALPRGLAPYIAGRAASGLPERLHVSQVGEETHLVVAEPRSSALLDTAIWPPRARRTAELVTLAVHRHMTGLEPSQEVFERDTAAVLSNRGAAALSDLLEQLDPGMAAGTTAEEYLNLPQQPLPAIATPAERDELVIARAMREMMPWLMKPVATAQADYVFDELNTLEAWAIIYDFTGGDVTIRPKPDALAAVQTEALCDRAEHYLTLFKAASRLLPADYTATLCLGVGDALDADYAVPVFCFHKAGCNISISTWPELSANAIAMARPVALAARLLMDPPVQATEAVAAESPALAAKVVAETRAVEAVVAPDVPFNIPPDGEYFSLQQLFFGDGGNEEAALSFGWAGPETGYRWTEGASCELWLEHPGQRNAVVTIEAWPLLISPAVEVQRAEVSAQDARLATLAFTVPARKSVYIPTASLRPGRILRLHFALPDAVRPCDVSDAEDDRQLGLGFIRVAVHTVSGRVDERRLGTGGIRAEEAQARTGLPPEELFGKFEALAGSQAFLEVQGVFGAAPQSLFRRGTLQLIDLVRAIDARFAGLGDLAHITSRLYEENPEAHEIIDDASKLSFLADRAVNDTSTDVLLARQSRRLKFLRDQLLYDFSTGEKIFVYHQFEVGLTEADMLPLLIALRQHGLCTLLFVTQADVSHPAGSVERVFPGLLHGYQAGTDAGDFVTQNVWIEICTNALALKGRD